MPRRVDAGLQVSRNQPGGRPGFGRVEEADGLAERLALLVLDALAADALAADALAADALAPDALAPDALAPDALATAGLAVLLDRCGAGRSVEVAAGGRGV